MLFVLLGLSPSLFLGFMVASVIVLSGSEHLELHTDLLSWCLYEWWDPAEPGGDLIPVISGDLVRRSEEERVEEEERRSEEERVEEEERWERRKSSLSRGVGRGEPTRLM